MTVLTKLLWVVQYVWTICNQTARPIDSAEAGGVWFMLTLDEWQINN